MPAIDSAAFLAGLLSNPVDSAVMPIATPNESIPIKIGPSPGLVYQFVALIAHKITRLVANAPAKTDQNLFRSPPNNELQKIPVKMDISTIHLMGI